MFTSRTKKIMRMAAPNIENTGDIHILGVDHLRSTSNSFNLLELSEESYNSDLPVCNLEDIIQDEQLVYTATSEYPTSLTCAIEIDTDSTVSQPNECDNANDPDNMQLTQDSCANDTQCNTTKENMTTEVDNGTTENQFEFAEELCSPISTNIQIPHCDAEKYDVDDPDYVLENNENSDG